MLERNYAITRYFITNFVVANSFVTEVDNKKDHNKHVFFVVRNNLITKPLYLATFGTVFIKDLSVSIFSADIRKVSGERVVLSF